MTKDIKNSSVSYDWYEAANYGDLDKVKSLLEKGADVNAADERGVTALMNAAYYGHLDIIKLLLEKGADVNAKDVYGYTPLILASGGGNLKAAKLILEYGADIDARDMYGKTACMNAVYSGKEEIVQLLQKHTTNDVNSIDDASTWADSDSYDGSVAISGDAQNNEEGL